MTEDLANLVNLVENFYPDETILSRYSHKREEVAKLLPNLRNRFERRTALQGSIFQRRNAGASDEDLLAGLQGEERTWAEDWIARERKRRYGLARHINLSLYDDGVPFEEIRPQCEEIISTLEGREKAWARATLNSFDLYHKRERGEEIPPGPHYDCFDPECVALCRVMNSLPGITTIESCCGHGISSFGVFFRYEASPEHERSGLCLLTLAQDRRYWRYGHQWKIELSISDRFWGTDGAVTYYLESVAFGEEAYRQADNLAERILEWKESKHTWPKESSK